MPTDGRGLPRNNLARGASSADRSDAGTIGDPGLTGWHGRGCGGRGSSHQWLASQNSTNHDACLTAWWMEGLPITDSSCPGTGVGTSHVAFYGWVGCRGRLLGTNPRHPPLTRLHSSVLGSS